MTPAHEPAPIPDIPRAEAHLRRPSTAAIALALIPFAAMCFSVSLWDRIEPMVFGLPFNLSWLIAWIVLTPLCMTIAYRIEAAQSAESPGP